MLALIAGQGELPSRVAASQPDAPLICAYEGFHPEGLGIDLVFRLETLGTLLVQLGEAGVTQVCFAGAIDRPALDPTKLDAETTPLVPLFLQALEQGDDGALRVVQDIFEQTGFEVLGAHELAPDILIRPGVLGDRWPNGQMRTDAAVGAAHIAAMAALDRGQACIVAQGKVVAMEDVNGTDHMIQNLPAAYVDQAAILFKGPKPGQNLKIDMPTLGPATFEAAQKAKLAGIVADADDVILLKPERCTALANLYGLVFWARTGE